MAWHNGCRVKEPATHGLEPSGTGSPDAKSVVQPLATHRSRSKSVASMPPHRDQRVTLALSWSCVRANGAGVHEVRSRHAANVLAPQAWQYHNRGHTPTSRGSVPACCATRPPPARAGPTQTGAAPVTCSRLPRSGVGTGWSRWPRPRLWWCHPQHHRHRGARCAVRGWCAGLLARRHSQ